MKVAKTDCPTLEELKSFLSGRVADDALPRLEAHLENCTRCLNVLSEIREKDSLVEAMRATPKFPEQDKVDPALAATIIRPANENARVESAASTIKRGSMIGGYEIITEIARGGMGVVYKARHPKLKRTVALKMILMGGLASSEIVNRFLAEAQAAAKLEHPGIVPVYEIGQHGNQHFFAMQFVDGPTLAKKLERGKLKPNVAVKLLRQIALAVHYAHENGVIHRDLKPGNVLITPKGHPKVTDFGLAKQMDSSVQLSMTGDILGTPSYMAPEQAAGQIRNIGPATDVYALGAILYAMLTGRPPFQAATALGTLKQVLEQEPAPLRTLRPELSPDLETICLKCLQKAPDKRYPTPLGLVEDLNRLIKDEPILARPIGWIERGVRWCRRDPRFAGAVFLSLLLVLVSVVVTVQSALRHSEMQAEIDRLAKAAEAKIQPSDQTNATSSVGKVNTAANGKQTEKVSKQIASTSVPEKVMKEWRNWPADAPEPAIVPFSENEAKKAQGEWARYLGVPVEWKNSLGMTFRLIPPGEFVMGLPPDMKNAQPDWVRDWRPVAITQPFYVATTEVTQEDFLQMTQRSPSYFSAIGNGRSHIQGIDTNRLPVEMVSWFDAIDFCNRLSQSEERTLAYRIQNVRKEGEATHLADADAVHMDADSTGYRLPTEAEWEFACRAGMKTLLNYGDDPGESTKYSRCNQTMPTAVVGSFLPNSFGLFDMHGNVCEWCFDEFRSDWNSSTVAINPTATPNNPNSLRVLRGGSWGWWANSTASGLRDKYHAGQISENPCSGHGFRIALPIDAVRKQQ